VIVDGEPCRVRELPKYVSQATELTGISANQEQRVISILYHRAREIVRQGVKEPMFVIVLQDHLT